MRRQSSPDTGKLSARPAGKLGCLPVEESLRRSLLRHSAAAASDDLGRSSECVWGGVRNLSVRWDGQNHSPTASAVVSCLPLVGPEAARGHAPRIDDEVLKPIPFVYRSATKCEGPRNAFFQAWRNLSVRCVITSDKPGPGCRFTVGSEPGYRTRRKKHALPIVRDEFRPAIP